MGVIGERMGRLEKSGHDQDADLKVDGVGVGRGAGEMSEATIGIAATQSPVSGLIHGFLTMRAVHP